MAFKLTSVSFCHKYLTTLFCVRYPIYFWHQICTLLLFNLVTAHSSKLWTDGKATWPDLICHSILSLACIKIHSTNLIHFEICVHVGLISINSHSPWCITSRQSYFLDLPLFPGNQNASAVLRHSTLFRLLRLGCKFKSERNVIWWKKRVVKF